MGNCKTLDRTRHTSDSPQRACQNKDCQSRTCANSPKLAIAALSMEERNSCDQATD